MTQIDAFSAEKGMYLVFLVGFVPGINQCAVVPYLLLGKFFASFTHDDEVKALITLLFAE